MRSLAWEFRIVEDHRGDTAARLKHMKKKQKNNGSSRILVKARILRLQRGMETHHSVPGGCAAVCKFGGGAEVPWISMHTESVE